MNTCDFYVMFTFLVIKNMQSLIYSQFLKEQKPVRASRLHVFLQLVTNTNMWLKDAAPRNRRRGRFLQISWRGQELCATWQKLCNFSPVFSDWKLFDHKRAIVWTSFMSAKSSKISAWWMSWFHDMLPYILPCFHHVFFLQISHHSKVTMAPPKAKQVQDSMRFRRDGMSLGWCSEL